jgi:hypothetical protein
MANPQIDNSHVVKLNAKILEGGMLGTMGEI